MYVYSNVFASVCHSIGHNIFPRRKSFIFVCFYFSVHYNNHSNQTHSLTLSVSGWLGQMSIFGDVQRQILRRTLKPIKAQNVFLKCTQTKWKELKSFRCVNWMIEVWSSFEAMNKCEKFTKSLNGSWQNYIILYILHTQLTKHAHTDTQVFFCFFFCCKR